MGFDEIKSARLDKLAKIKESGADPYPAERAGLFPLAEVKTGFNSLKKKKSLVLSGRIIAIRTHGGSVFCDISDGRDKFQVYLKEDEVGRDSFTKFAETADVGDIHEFKGRLFLTKKNEKTLLVSHWRFLAKSLRSLPEKWHGLQDVEERYRHRYLDLISNQEVRNNFDRRTALISEIRRFLDKIGFQEVETPLLQAIPGGASAKPFKTRHNALDADFYLRIAPELHLKQLLIGGLNKIYEIGRSFRNEGIDATHNPEFTELELYEAYTDAESHMDFVEKLIKYLAKTVSKSSVLKYQGSDINFSKKFARMSFEDALGRFALINNYRKMSDEEFVLKAKQFGVEIERGDTKAKTADKIFKKICRPKIIQPTFVLYYPLDILPLAKESKNHLGMADMYQLVVGGLELVKGVSELNDPEEQRKRFEAQEAMRKSGDEEASRMDEDFLEAMEYGMPPAAGLGIGIDRLAMLFTDSANIREVILFPTMRPK